MSSNIAVRAASDLAILYLPEFSSEQEAIEYVEARVVATIECAHGLLWLYDHGWGYKRLSERFGIPRTTVRDLLKRKGRGADSPPNLKDLGHDTVGCDIRNCSVEELFASGVRPDVVVTDPPYPAEFLPVFSQLASSCKEAEVPLVAVMSGQYHLPKVLSLMCEHLRYRWTLAYMTPGQKTVVFGAQVNTAWKPVLLFGAKDAMLPTDVVVSDMPDKEHHTWGQSESGMAGLISLLSRPGDLVCDPFVGAGTTAVEALRAGRRFVGCDIDEECVKRSIQRCAEVLDGVQAGRDLEEGYVDIGQTP